MKKFDNGSVFCYQIKRIRKENKLTQKEMAHKLGVSVSTLSKIEKGIIPPRLSCSILFCVQKEFGIQPKDLFAPPAS